MAYVICETAKNIAKEGSIVDKFERFCWLIGADKVEKLAHATVVIIGCGGVGGYVIESLARSNIGKLIIVDYDVVSISNCNRQIIALDSTIGHKKVECFVDRIKEINRQCQVVAYDEKLTRENIGKIIGEEADFVVDACDDVFAKLVLIQYCIERDILMISSMGTGNRMDPSKLCITTLSKTQNDPLARVMRQKVKKAGITSEIPVCTSQEIPVKLQNKIASCSFVPASAGLLIASYVVSKLIKES